MGPRALERDKRRVGEVIRRVGLPHEMTVLVDEDHRQCVMRKHLAGDVRDAGKDGADVEDVRDRPEQLDGALDFVVLLALRRGMPLCQLSIGQPVSEAMGEALQVAQAARGESLRVPGKQRQHACNPIVDLDGDREASLQAAIRPGYHIEQPWLGRLQHGRCHVVGDALGRVVQRSRI